MVDGRGGGDPGIVAVIGVDGSGKSTQVGLLAERARSAGHRAGVLPNVSVGPLRRFIHESGAIAPEVRRCQFNLFAVAKWAAARAELDRCRADGATSVLVADRWGDCFTAVSTGADGPAWGDELYRRTLPEPLCVVCLDVPAEVGATRVGARDGDEAAIDLETLSAVRDRYLHLAAARGHVVIDGTPPVAEVADRVWRVVAPSLPRR